MQATVENFLDTAITQPGMKLPDDPLAFGIAAPGYILERFRQPVVTATQ